MTMTDPIADLLTRIRNINRLGRRGVSAPHSVLKEEVLKVLKREGFIEDYRVVDAKGERVSGPHKNLDIVLKFGPEGEHVINTIERVSRPGQRIYRKVKELQPVLQGMGIAVVSTPKGVLSDSEARAQNVGGEVLCQVY